MKPGKKIKIVILEDDLYYNKALTKYVHTLCSSAHYVDFSFKIDSFLTAEDCLENLEKDTDILILDYYLAYDEINGATIVQEVNEYCDKCRIVMVSSLQNANVIHKLRAIGIYEFVDKNINSKDRVGAVLQNILRENFAKAS